MWLVAPVWDITDSEHFNLCRKFCCRAAVENTHFRLSSVHSKLFGGSLLSPGKVSPCPHRTANSAYKVTHGLPWFSLACPLSALCRSFLLSLCLAHLFSHGPHSFIPLEDIFGVPTMCQALSSTEPKERLFLPSGGFQSSGEHTHTHTNMELHTWANERSEGKHQSAWREKYRAGHSFRGFRR